MKLLILVHSRESKRHLLNEGVVLRIFLNRVVPLPFWTYGVYAYSLPLDPKLLEMGDCFISPCTSQYKP